MKAAARQHSAAERIISISMDAYEDEEEEDSLSREGDSKRGKEETTAIRAARRMQRAFRRRRFVTAVEKAMMLNRMRKHVLREILSSEKVYERSLACLVTQFVRPLQAVLSADQVEMCFPSVVLIADLHKNALPSLDSLPTDLLSLASRVEPVYGPHVVHLARAMRLLQTVTQSNAKARAVIEAAVSENGCLKGMDYLNSLIIGPTQRLARYPLLLREVLKYSSDVHRDHAQLTQALALFRDDASAIDSAKKNEDQLRRKLFLQSHGSTDVRALHSLEAKTSSAVRECAVCERAIWGVSRKHWKCTQCRCKVHLECKAPALCGTHCVRAAKLDLAQSTILAEYYVEMANGTKGYVLLTSRGVGLGEEIAPNDEQLSSLDCSRGTDVHITHEIKWKEVEVEERSGTDGAKRFVMAVFARQVVIHFPTYLLQICF